MATLKQKQRGAILAALVGDAAVVPLHWQYDQGKVQEAIKDSDGKKLADFAFLPESKAPFYTLPTGATSCYGDEFLSMLVALADNEGKLDIDKYKKALFDTFGGETNAYQVAFKKKAENKYPIQGPWLNHSVKEFVDKYEAKAEQTAGESQDNDALMGAMAYTVIAAGSTGDADQEAKENKGDFPKDDVVAILKTLTVKEDVIARSTFVCQVLFTALTGSEKLSMEELLSSLNEKYNKTDNPEIYKEIQEVLDDFKAGKFAKGRIDAGKAYGLPCPQPGSLKGSLFGLIQDQKDYKANVLAEIETGGDSLARVIINSCLLGAVLGEDCVPKEWLAKTTNAAKIQDLLQKLVK